MVLRPVPYASRPPGEHVTAGVAGASDDVDALVDLVSRGSAVVLTGAGISTDSGIPDYRGPTGLARKATPMQYAELVGSEAAQRRYWARSFAGWPLIRRAAPNDSHHAVADLQRAGLVDAVITQNVDRLHDQAGSDPVVELHGSLDRVVCLACGDRSDRAELQTRLAEANPGFDVAAADIGDDTGQVRPDGDVELLGAMVERFALVPCTVCGGGPLKPDVVFFGENVPRERVARCYELVDEASTLLVLGSSLTVMSGYRFVRHAAKRSIDVVIVNQGATRGDEQATLRLDAPLAPLLTSVVAAVGV